MSAKKMDKKSTKKDEVSEATGNAPLKIIIPEKAKTVNLTLEELRQTRTFANAFSVMPKQFPLEHHVFIQKIIDMATEVKAEPVVNEIVASVAGIERISTTEAESKDLDPEEAQNTRVQTLIGRIDLGNKYAKKLWNLAIGFMYNEKGIEVCIGTNISICSNLTIYGNTKHYKNYGRDKVDITEMFEYVETWLKDLEGIDGINSELLERMDKCKIDWEEMSDQFIGRLLKEAVRMNYHKGGPFPLSQTQVARVASYIIDFSHEMPIEEMATMSLYHLYNAGTYVITRSDKLEERFANIKEFTNWFEQAWLIPAEEELNGGIPDTETDPDAEPIGPDMTEDETLGNNDNTDEGENQKTDN